MNMLSNKFLRTRLVQIYRQYNKKGVSCGKIGVS